MIVVAQNGQRSKFSLLILGDSWDSCKAHQRVIMRILKALLYCCMSVQVTGWTGTSPGKSSTIEANKASPLPQGTVEVKTSGVSRRDALFSVAATTLIANSATPKTAAAYTPDPDKLQESLYFISRVQEATVLQERFVSRAKMQEDLQKKMKLTLKLVEKNYRLLDQITYCSGFVEPKNDVVIASEAGYEAVDALQGAVDFVKNDLGTGPLTDKQRDFLTSCMQDTRENLFAFLKYMPSEKLAAARLRVEDENLKNRDEFDGDEDAGVYNPIVLPWKLK
jgi:hypothetical protein